MNQWQRWKIRHWRLFIRNTKGKIRTQGCEGTEMNEMLFASPIDNMELGRQVVTPLKQTLIIFCAVKWVSGPPRTAHSPQ